MDARKDPEHFHRVEGSLVQSESATAVAKRKLLDTYARVVEASSFETTPMKPRNLQIPGRFRLVFFWDNRAVFHAKYLLFFAGLTSYPENRGH